MVYKDIREYLGLSKVKMSSLMDIGYSSIYRYESGKTKPHGPVLFIYSVLYVCMTSGVNKDLLMADNAVTAFNDINRVTIYFNAIKQAMKHAHGSK